MRKKQAQVRSIDPDQIYNSVLVAKFINGLMKDGKKSIASNIFYESMGLIEKKMDNTEGKGIDIFLEAINKVKPSFEVRSRRVGGSTYQIPIEVREARQQILAIRWIIDFSRKRKERTMAQRLSGEIMDAFNSRGEAFKRKVDTYKMAEANKAFAHYRW